MAAAPRDAIYLGNEVEERAGGYRLVCLEEEHELIGRRSFGGADIALLLHGGGLILGPFHDGRKRKD